MTPELRANFLKDCEEAIQGQNLGLDLQRVALRMRIDGLSQQEAHDIIQSAKEAVTGSRFYGDHPKDDMICEILDGVVGWCASSCHIWSPHFDAKSELSKLDNNPGNEIEQGR